MRSAARTCLRLAPPALGGTRLPRAAPRPDPAAAAGCHGAWGQRERPAGARGLASARGEGDGFRLPAKGQLFQQQKQRDAARLRDAAAAVHERRLPEELRGREPMADEEFHSVVEQRIRQAMREGEFDGLALQGKPLPMDRHPHLDRADAVANSVLKNSGFAPEFVELGKDLREAIGKYRIAIKAALAKRADAKPGSDSVAAWEEDARRLQAGQELLNRKILHYNLLAPPFSQMFRLNWATEMERGERELGTAAQPQGGGPDMAAKLWAQKPALDALSPPVGLVCLVKENLPEQIAEYKEKFWPGELYLDASMSFYKALGGGTEHRGSLMSFLNPFSRVWKNNSGAPAGNFVGEGLIMGGMYVVGPSKAGPEVHFEFSEKTFGDFPPDEQIMQAARATAATIAA